MTGAAPLLAAGIISDITDWLDELSANWWFLAAIAVIAFLDSVVPVVPSETTVIIGGVAASSAGAADYPLWAVIACGAVGAFSVTTRRTCSASGRRDGSNDVASADRSRNSVSTGPHSRSARAAVCC